jgi:GNAT superfamily N-acetyltransferase
VERPAREDDRDAIAALYHEVWHETHAALMPAEESRLRTQAFFIERVRGLLPTTVVGVRGGRIVGFAAWTGALLGQLYVGRADRGSGVAGLLLAGAERRMAAEGTGTAELHCIVGNGVARRFYERSGWIETGIVTEPVAGPGGPFAVEFWCMTKPLSPTGGRSG